MAAHFLSKHSDANIDRGWAFPFAGASFLCHALIFGISFSSAIFYVIFLEVFQHSPATTAWTVGLNTCATYLFLPVGTFFHQYVGDTCTVVVGALLSSLGLICSAFAPNLLTLFLTFGLLTGVGWALVLLGAVHGVYLFFRQYRKFAIAFATTGISCGQFLYPPLIEWLLTIYGWRGAMWILGGLNLNLLIIPAILVAGRANRLAQREMELLVKTAPSQQSHPEKSTLRRHLQKLTDFLDLAREPFFLLFNISTVLSALAVGSFQTHITRTSLLAGHDSFMSAMLPSAIGASGLAGRLAWGLLAQKVRHLNVVWLTVICYAILGCVGLICVFCRSYPALLTCSLLFGLLIGVWSLLSEVMVIVVGIEQLINAIGINGIFTGAGLLIGPPFAAWLSQSYPSYRLSFGSGVIAMFVSSLLLLPSARWITGSKVGWARRRQSEAVNFETS